MSNIKDLFGDISLEEFEEKRKTVLFEIRKLYDEDVKLSSDTHIMYDYWLKLHGIKYAQKWVKYNGTNNQINHEQVIVFIDEMFDKFTKWVNEID